MAKKTKDSNLSIEERLEQTVVPNWDYPYIIPQNWVFFWFTKLIDIEGGTQPPKSQFVDCELDGYVRLVQIRDFSSDKYIVFVPDSNKLRHFNENDILIARYGASLGKICTGLKGVYNVALAKTIFSEEVLNRKYVYWMLHSESFQNPLMTISRTAQAGFNKDDLSRFAMPLPPLAEQQRIVEHIESLFEKLDEAKEKAQEVVDGFETRKAAILHKAFSGELTAKWRKENTPAPASEYLEELKNDDSYSIRSEIKYWNNESLPAGWCESKIGNLLYFAGRIGWKGLKAEEYTASGPLLLSVYNLNDGDEVTYNRVYHITQERYEESPEIMVEIGDVLLTKDGAGIGKLGYVKELPEKATINSSLLLLRPSKSAVSKYIYYILLGPALQSIVKERITGSATPHLFQRDIKEFVLPIPSLEEQIEIVRILDSLLLNENKAKESAELVLEQIDVIKKSILVRAFRGELGTNDSTEESAIELLKKILCEDAVSQNPTKKPTKRITISEDIKKMLSTVREEEIIKLLLKSAPKPVSIQEIMSLSSKKFELMDALRSLEKKQLIIKNESGEYSLTR